jgi:cyclopropane-fatty-acyl-phospholipid synthase
MALLTTEHGRMGYLADFALYAIASTALAVLLAVAAPHERRVEILVFAFAGLAMWTLVEYVLHRFVLHGLQPFRAWHAEHHRRPRARIATPAILSAALITALVFIPALVLRDSWRAGALSFGLLTGYLIYTIVHHAAHHWRGDPAWLRGIRRHHALHHSPVAAHARYGVTSTLWDVVFRTNGPPAVPHTAPARRAMS